MKSKLRYITLCCLVVFSIFPNFSLFAQSDSESYGWLKIETNIEQFYLILNDDYQNYTLMQSGDSIKVQSGMVKIRMIWHNFNDFVQTIRVDEGVTTAKNYNIHITRFSRSSYDQIENGRNVTITTDIGGNIYVDGNIIGKSYSELLLSPGIHSLKIEHPEYGDLNTNFDVKFGQINEIGRYNQDPSPLPFVFKLIPGVSYLDNKQQKKAFFTYVGLSATTALAFIFNKEYEDKEAEYDKLYAEYLLAQTAYEAGELRLSALSARDDLEYINKKITASLVSALVIYAATTLDGFRKPKAGYHGPANLIPEFSVNSNPMNGNVYPAVGLNISF